MSKYFWLYLCLSEDTKANNKQRIDLFGDNVKSCETQLLQVEMPEIIKVEFVTFLIKKTMKL